MRINHVVLVVSSLFLMSCFKELPSVNRRVQNPDTFLGTGLLEKIVSVAEPNNTDSVVQLFTYDNSGRLIEENFIARYMNGGTLVTRSSQTLYERDGNHRIVKIVRNGVPSDNGVVNNVVEYVQYEDASSTKVVSLGDGNTMFEYDANGRVAKTMTYLPSPPGLPKLGVYHIYNYDAVGNMIRREEYTDHDNDGSFELNITYSFEYDGYLNPFLPGDDALIEWTWTRSSPANVLKQKNDVADPQGIDDENVIIYEYGNDNKPKTALFIGNGSNSRIHYYYK